MIRKGTYALFMFFSKDLDIEVGSLGFINIKVGEYCYVGSAMGGLDQRISRHILKNKNVYWHIDRLTVVADRIEAFESFPRYVEECKLSSMAMESGCIPVISGFGCSDCCCDTHLFMVDATSKDKFISFAGLTEYVGPGRAK